MLKITVSPLDNKNSSIPNRTPLSVEMTISSSTAPLAEWLDGPGKTNVRVNGSLGTSMLWQNPVRNDARGLTRWPIRGRFMLQAVGSTVCAVSILDTRCQPQPVFFVVERLLGLVGQAAERGDVDRLEELVVVLAHEALAAIEHVKLSCLQALRRPSPDRSSWLFRRPP